MSQQVSLPLVGYEPLANNILLIAFYVGGLSDSVDGSNDRINVCGISGHFQLRLWLGTYLSPALAASEYRPRLGR